MLIPIVALALAGCALPTRTVLVCPSVPETIRPILPAVTAEDLAPLTEDAARRLKERERVRREYAEMLETILGSVRTKCRELSA